LDRRLDAPQGRYERFGEEKNIRIFGRDDKGIQNFSLFVSFVFSAPVQTGRGAHPASYTMGTGSFPGVKWTGRGVDHPPHLAPKERVELYLYSPFGPSWAVLG